MSTPEMRYNNIVARFKREAGMPIHFTDLSEEQKVLIEIICEEGEGTGKSKVITETIELIKNDLDFVLYELEKLD